MADQVSFFDRMRTRDVGTSVGSSAFDIAQPRVLGLYAFAGAMFLLATHVAGWYTGSAEGNVFLFPFAATLGGVLQSLAAMWAYRARDTLGTAMLGTWGAFFIGYGLLTVAVMAAGVATTAVSELGYWAIVLAAISWVGAAAAATGRDVAGAGWLTFAAAGSTLAAIGLIGGFMIINIIAAWLFIISSLIAWYGATALLFQATGRALPLHRTIRREEAVAEVGEQRRAG